MVENFNFQTASLSASKSKYADYLKSMKNEKQIGVRAVAQFEIIQGQGGERF
jgi:hypothetical protein